MDGIVATLWPMLEPVRASYRVHAAPAFRDSVQVVGSSFDGWEGVVGAASVVLDPSAGRRPSAGHER